MIGCVPNMTSESHTKPNESKTYEYFNGYGGCETVQPAKEAIYDSQLKSISLYLADKFRSLPRGTVIDVGCGNGILLKRLSLIETFIGNSEWFYFGTDCNESLENVSRLSFELKLNRRIELIGLDSFYAQWPLVQTNPRPHLVVIRNVFHELDFAETANLLHLLHSNQQQDELLVIQDLLTFVQGERNNVCWDPQCLTNVLSFCQYEAMFVDDTSARGNMWFTISAVNRKTAGSNLSLEQITEKIIDERCAQLQKWDTDERDYLGDLGRRDPKIAILDFDLQRGALHKQLNAYNSSRVPPLDKKQEGDLVRTAFHKYISQISTVPRSFIDPTSYFRDRAQDQDWLEAFLLDASKKVCIILGSPLMGKSLLTNQVLSRRAHDKVPLFIDIQSTSNVWNLIEDLLTSFGCKIPGEILRDIRLIDFEDIRSEIEEAISRVSDRIILVFDHFERLLNTERKVYDKEIENLLGIIFKQPGSKTIVTSRTEPIILFGDQALDSDLKRTVGRLPKGQHVENILDDFVDRGVIGLAEYPGELLEAIDQHPYLTYLTARLLQHSGEEKLTDLEFMGLLKNKMRDELIRLLVTEESKEAVEILSLLRIPVPKQMVDELAGESSFVQAENAGLVVSFKNASYERLVRGIGALRIEEENDPFEDDSPNEMQDNIYQKHRKIAAYYEKLYKIDWDPRWLRELYYHRLCTVADERDIRSFGKVYAREIAWAGDWWFQRRVYETALWAYTAAINLGIKTTFIEMRIASCLMRTRQIQLGEERYKSLIENVGSVGIIRSYVDSLLYIGDFSQALTVLQDSNLKLEHDPWITHQYGRAYFGLHLYKEAIHAFKLELQNRKDEIVFSHLSSAYFHIGDRENEQRILTEGLKYHKKSKYLIILNNAFLIRTGTTDVRHQAAKELESRYNEYPYNGRMRYELIKYYCREGRVSDAIKILDKGINARGMNAKYDIPMRVEVYIAQNRYSKAIDLLKSHYSDNEHLLGLLKKAYLLKALGENGETRIATAKSGLGVKMHGHLEQNVPLMITSARLAHLAGEQDEFTSIIDKIGIMNQPIADMLKNETDDNDNFPHGMDNIYY